MKNHACNLSEICISSAFQKDNYTSKNTQAKSASRQQSRSDSRACFILWQSSIVSVVTVSIFYITYKRASLISTPSPLNAHHWATGNVTVQTIIKHQVITKLNYTFYLTRMVCAVARKNSCDPTATCCVYQLLSWLCKLKHDHPALVNN